MFFDFKDEILDEKVHMINVLESEPHQISQTIRQLDKFNPVVGKTSNIQALLQLWVCNGALKGVNA